MINQLTYLYNTFCHALDDGKEVRAVFCDISKAFDRVWHSGLLHKLQAAGVTGEVIAWFKSYLSDRKQRVIVPGAVSDWKFNRAGVPQGSILGPFLFILYINDIVNDIGSNIRLFADDTSLFIIVENPVTAAAPPPPPPLIQTLTESHSGLQLGLFLLILPKLDLFSFPVKLINIITHLFL